ncbi:MAG TPA: hypothetical protein VGB02_03320 [Pyrinomonadaceae bacterium]|jgi:hypothetical protein
MKHKRQIVFVKCALGIVLLSSCSDTDQVSNAATSPTPAQTGSSQNQANGWNPIEACGYLSGVSNLQTRGYKNKYEDVFGCSSPYKEINAGSALANNLAYYVDGDAQTATQLKLVLNVNQAQQSKEAHAALLSSSQDLTQKSLGSALPKDVSSAILSGKAGKWTIGKAQVDLKRENFQTGKGYELHFIIKRKG